MIIQKNYSIGDIVVLRLVSGEEVLGKLLSENSDVYCFSRPIVLQMQMVSANQAGIAFAPFMVGISEDRSVSIRKSACITTVEIARDDVKSNYIKATTGLEVPGSGGMII